MNATIDLRLVLPLCDTSTKRRLEVLGMVQNGVRMSSSDLQRMFDVSHATAKRDLSAVRRVIRETAS